ncbi:hypothetical protein P0W64_06035 [Tsukamurella sp. 8F]|uniref:hypothetical protein n=1 Tax=unclassified Tsukamurella TaxID=2633480 RepID=UPI0023B9B8CB|nr:MULTISPECIES: hypothetical protein [unclassified Tsukamurella]MDF0528504.1 hypothetical protein [Tsukamurella sp. 8J]MDF0586330.1 hypothetical protein [Tsukamurella sp. 8F]
MAGSDETRTWSAGRSVGRGMVPGRLGLTRTHVTFEPGGVAKRTAGLRFSVQLEHVAAVGITPGTGKWLSGGKRDRLCLTLGDGSEVLFVVPELDDATACIRDALGSR